MRVSREARASAEEFVSEAQTALRVRLRVGLLRLCSNSGSRCSVVDLLVLQMHGVVVLLLLLQRGRWWE